MIAKSRIVGSCALALATLQLTSCAGLPAEPAPKPLRLVFVTCAVNQRFFDPVKLGMRDAAEMLGVECSFVGTPGVDLIAQAELVRQAIADGCDGVALNIIDPQAFDAVVAEATEQGVPVVAFNVDDHASPNARLSAVCQRLYAAGCTLGRRAAQWIPAGSHILMTQHDAGVSALDDRLRGAQSELQKKGITWTVSITGNVAKQGADVIAAALRANPGIRVILGTGQADTEAAGLAIERGDAAEGSWSAGFDLSPDTLRLIKAGHIRFTIDQQPYIQGFYPVVQLTHYLRYGIKPSNIDAGATVIDRESVDQVIELTNMGVR